MRKSLPAKSIDADRDGWNDEDRPCDFLRNQLAPHCSLAEATTHTNPESIQEFPDPVRWRTCQRCADVVTAGDYSTLTQISLFQDGEGIATDMMSKVISNFARVRSGPGIPYPTYS